MEPRVTVVLPTYNRCKDLERCINSLMRQSFKDFELLVIDNGSTDGTLELLKLYPVRVIRDSTKNIFYLANLGWKEASTEIVAYISDDCEAEPEWIENIVKSFSSFKDAGAVGGPAIATQRQEIARLYEGAKNSISSLLVKIYEVIVLENRYSDIAVLLQSGAFSMGGSMHHSAKLKQPIHVDFLTLTNMAVKREAMQATGGFDESYVQHHGDAELSIRMRKRGYILIFHPRAVVLHHPNPRGPSRGAYQIGKDYARFYLLAIHPRSLSGSLRLTMNMLFFCVFWLFKALQSKSLVPLSGVVGFVSGVFDSLPLRSSV